MTEVTFSYRATCGLNVLPKVVIGEFKDLGKQFQKSSINRLGEVLHCLEVNELTRIDVQWERTVEKAVISSMNGCTHLGIFSISSYSGV